MIYSKYRISLDIRSIGSQVVLMSKRLETGREIYITLTEGLKTYTITDDCYAVFAAIKPDGNFLFNFCDIKDNTIIYTYTPQTTIVAGKMECEIRLYSAAGEMLASAFFGILISETIVDEGEVIESAFESTTVVALVEEKVKEHLLENPIATDATLTDPEAAANAKATGDAINQLAEQTQKSLEELDEAKVGTEEGKGLSTNDFTNEMQETLLNNAQWISEYYLPIAGNELGGVRSGDDVKVSEIGELYLEDESVDTDAIAKGAVTAEKIAEDAVRIRATDVAVATTAFAEDTTYEDFPYRAAIGIVGATAAMKPDVTFSYEQIASGVFSSVCESYDGGTDLGTGTYSGGVYIYASAVPEADITIPVKDLWRREHERRNK